MTRPRGSGFDTGVVVRRVAAVATFGLGIGVLRGLTTLTPGIAHGGVRGLVAAVLGAPATWATVAISSIAMILVVSVLDAGRRRAPVPASTWELVEPLRWGMGAPCLALLLDPWWTWSTASVLTAAGLGIGILVAASRWARGGGAVRPSPILLGVVAVIVPLTLAAPGPPAWPSLSGDEPHYLLYARSLWVDHDIDLGRDYGEGDYREFYAGRLDPHTKSGLEPESRLSTHGIGTALWLAPWYGLARALDFEQRQLEMTSRLAMAVWLGLFALVLHALLRDVSSRRAAVAGTAVAVLTTPLLFLAPHVFPDLPALTLGATTYLLVRRRPGCSAAAAAGASGALLPWLGVKYFALLAGLVIAGAVWLWPRRRARGSARWAPLLLFLLPAVASTLLHLAFTWQLYGSLSPLALYLGAGQQAAPAPAKGGDLGAYLSDPAGIFRSGAGLFLDQRTGLLLVAPQYLLAFLGASWMWRRRRRDLLLSLLILVTYASVYALSQERTGWSPPGRALVPVLWTVAVPLGVGLERLGRGVERARPTALGRWLPALSGGFLAVGVGITVILASQVSLLYHDYGVAHSLMALRYGAADGLRVWRWLPLWTGPGQLRWGVNAAWSSAIVALALLLWRAGSRSVSGTPVRAAGDDLCRKPNGEGFVSAARGAAAVWLTGIALLLLHHLWVPISGDRRAHAYGQVAVWTSDLRPKRAWAEQHGIWFRGPDALAVPLESPTPLAALRLEVSTLMRKATAVGLSVGGDSATVEVRLGRPAVVELRPRWSTEWNDDHFCLLGVSVSAGSSPARLGMDPDDVRPLGAYVRLLDVRLVRAGGSTSLLGRDPSDEGRPPFGTEVLTSLP